MFGNNNKKKSLSEEIRKKIKRIEIFSKRLMKGSLVGDYLSAFKGSGLEFDQIREYQIGDDIRFIDWNSSAKMSKIMFKQLIEERDRTVILLIDISNSSSFSSSRELKKDMIAQVGAVLAYIASENKDRVGAVFFSDRVERWISPSRGKLHVGKIIETIFSIKPKGTKTNIQEVLNFLVGLKKRNSIVFILSDLIDEDSDYSKILKVAACEYDLVGIRFLDECEKSLPEVGLIEIEDLESEKFYIVDTRDKKIDGKFNLNVYLKSRLIEQKKIFEKYRIDLLDLVVGRPFINPMNEFFRSRIKRQI
ncbi:DUF58 domain-containing protein [Candidatus Babeliales bacterium]|nr:DUF58 domain-containing protein [Candidatus Babeliales bacterium]